MGSFLSFVSLATKYLGDPVAGGDTRKKGGAGAENDYRGGGDVPKGVWTEGEDVEERDWGFV